MSIPNTDCVFSHLFMILEICAQSYPSAVNAYQAGAHRIELCTDLPSGGTTPSIELITQVCKEVKIPVFVLIRSRSGNFIYDHHEVKFMKDQIKIALDGGAAGIVAGAITEMHDLDERALYTWRRACEAYPFTFHRAFELIIDEKKAIHTLKEYRVDRILTGGKSGNAYQSRNELAHLNTLMNKQITLLAGSGISSKNVKELIQVTGVHEVHTSAKYGFDDPTHSAYESNPFEIEKILEEIKIS